MATNVEETGLATRTEHTSELTPTAGAAEKQFEIQSAIVIARKYPRDEEQAFARLMKSSMRPSFADEASYSFKRGKKKDVNGKWVDNFVEGPSINLAREAARLWGNIRYGLEVIRDDDENRQIRGWAWDLETNVKVAAEDEFKKLVQRKQYDESGRSTGTAWVTPDERDLRELTNRRGAILIRNCILQLMPSDLIEDARAQCDKTIEAGAKTDPEAARKKLIIAFGALNISPAMLEQKLGHKLAESSPAEIAELRKIYKSIADGNSTWAEYVEPARKEAEKGTVNLSELKPGREGNRGHGDENLSAAGRKSDGPEPRTAKAAAATPADNQSYATGADPDPFAAGGDLFGRDPGA